MKAGDTAQLSVEVLRVGTTLALVRLPMSTSMESPTVVDALVPLSVLTCPEDERVKRVEALAEQLGREAIFP